jgi:bifunctional non-homologous end joining protein LigD
VTNILAVIAVIANVRAKSA